MPGRVISLYEANAAALDAVRDGEPRLERDPECGEATVWLARRL
jgi:hypothetical protein